MTKRYGTLPASTQEKLYKAIEKMQNLEKEYFANLGVVNRQLSDTPAHVLRRLDEMWKEVLDGYDLDPDKFPSIYDDELKIQKLHLNKYQLANWNNPMVNGVPPMYKDKVKAITRDEVERNIQILKGRGVDTDGIFSQDYSTIRMKQYQSVDEVTKDAFNSLLMAMQNAKAGKISMQKAMLYPLSYFKIAMRDFENDPEKMAQVRVAAGKYIENVLRQYPNLKDAEEVVFFMDIERRKNERATAEAQREAQRVEYEKQEAAKLKQAQAELENQYPKYKELSEADRGNLIKNYQDIKELWGSMAASYSKDELINLEEIVVQEWTTRIKNMGLDISDFPLNLNSRLQ